MGGMAEADAAHHCPPHVPARGYGVWGLRLGGLEGGVGGLR